MFYEGLENMPPFFDFWGFGEEGVFVKTEKFEIKNLKGVLGGGIWVWNKTRAFVEILELFLFLVFDVLPFLCLVPLFYTLTSFRT